MIEQRIQLAESMGWEKTCTDNGFGVLTYWRHPRTVIADRDNVPDPFTDANDDYAVLEWMRTQSHPFIESDYRYLDAVVKVISSAELYEIGDYARAAISVLTQKDSE